MIFNFEQSFVRMVYAGPWSVRDCLSPRIFFQKLEDEMYLARCLGLLVFMDSGRPGDKFL